MNTPTSIDSTEAPETGRSETLQPALQRLAKFGTENPVLVETGTLRNESPRGRHGDGWSSLAWAWFAVQSGGTLHTVDIDPDCLDACRRVTAEYAPYIQYHHADSLEFLQDYAEKVAAGEAPRVSLFYLDSMDYLDEVGKDRSEQHHLAEAQLAHLSAAESCLILFDDTEEKDGSYSGKGARAIPWLIENGWTLEWCHAGQALLSREQAADDDNQQSEISTHQSAIGGLDNVQYTIPALSAPSAPLRLTPPPTGTNDWRYLTPELWREERWSQLRQLPLRDSPHLFQHQISSPYLQDYLATVLRLCPPGARTLEVGSDHGFGSAWLSHIGADAGRARAVAAEFLDGDPRVVERSRAANGLLASSANPRHGDPFLLYEPEAPRWTVIHHQGQLQQYPVPWMRALLAQQVCMAEFVVFSVPSVYYPFEASGRERLLPLEEWRRILQPFKVRELRYYGDPRLGGREHVLVVLEGQRPTGALRHLMQVSAHPFPEGISAIVHTKNEERQIGECLETIYGFADEIIVADMGSTDRTLEIASRYTNNIFHHPQIDLLDQARNAAACRARYSWVCVLDADERFTPLLRPRVRQLIAEQGSGLAAIQIPFLHYFAGKWLTSLYPGYKAPTLCRNGCFYFHPRPHAGPHVEGRLLQFQPESRELLEALSITHFSFDSVEHYINKMNRYTGVEAAGMLADGRHFDWREAICDTVDDMCMYFDTMGGKNDGTHGLIYALVGGVYRLMQHAKLYESRFRSNSLLPEEQQAPASMEEVLAFALARVRARS